jgi:hypothetical protein
MNNARGIAAERIASFPLKNLPARTKNKEKRNPDSMAIIMGLSQSSIEANITVIIEVL